MVQSWDISTLGKPVPAKLDFMAIYGNNDYEDFYDYNCRWNISKLGYK